MHFDVVSLLARNSLNLSDFTCGNDLWIDK